MKKFALCLAALAMLAVLPACSKAIKTEGVTGVITYNGEPLADATVKFIPTDSTGSQSYGKTNEKGEYKVTVDCVKSVPTGKMIEENGQEIEEMDVEYVLPQKFGNPETSGLTATVAPGDNTINFDLTD